MLSSGRSRSKQEGLRSLGARQGEYFTISFYDFFCFVIWNEHIFFTTTLPAISLITNYTGTFTRMIITYHFKIHIENYLIYFNQNLKDEWYREGTILLYCLKDFQCCDSLIRWNWILCYTIMHSISSPREFLHQWYDNIAVKRI